MHLIAHARPLPRVLFTALVLATSAVARQATAPREYTIEQFMATTRYSGASFSPSEDKLLYSSNGVAGLWRVVVR